MEIWLSQEAGHKHKAKNKLIMETWLSQEADEEFETNNGQNSKKFLLVKEDYKLKIHSPWKLNHYTRQG